MHCDYVLHYSSAWKVGVSATQKSKVRAIFMISRVDSTEAIFPFIAVWDDVWMKYGLSLDQKKLHGSYQIVDQQCRVCSDCHFLPKELE